PPPPPHGHSNHRRPNLQHHRSSSPSSPTSPSTPPYNPTSTIDEPLPRRRTNTRGAYSPRSSCMDLPPGPSPLDFRLPNPPRIQARPRLRSHHCTPPLRRNLQLRPTPHQFQRHSHS